MSVAIDWEAEQPFAKPEHVFSFPVNTFNQDLHLISTVDGQSFFATDRLFEWDGSSLNAIFGWGDEVERLLAER